MGDRKRITALRAFWWVQKLSNVETIDKYDLRDLRNDFRNHVEHELTRASRRSKGGRRG